MKKNPSITPPPQRIKPRSPAAIALSVALFPIWFPFWAYGVFLAAQFDRTRDFSKWLYGRYECYRYGGFTLIELSIVLVIIGLIVGGVLTGQHLIAAAAVRAEISQIEKFNTAVNTFKGKYGALPGDIQPALVTQFGFATLPSRAGTVAQGDGNGVIQGIDSMSSVNGVFQVGETVWFWVDLTANSGLIPGNFNSATATPVSGQANFYSSSSPYISQLLPTAMLGTNAYVYVYSNAGTNYFGLSGIAPSSYIDLNGAMHSGIPVLTVAQAYAVDKKIDDGMPQTGNVIAQFEDWDTYGAYSQGIIWAAGGSVGSVGALPGTAAPPSATTCYDNGGNTSNPMAYSLTQNNGSGVNCALSFRMQAGD